MSDKTIVLTVPEDIQAFRLLALRGALHLEVLGMRRSGRSALSIIKEEFNLKGNKQRVLAQYEAMLRERGILRDGTETA